MFFSSLFDHKRNVLVHNAFVNFDYFLKILLILSAFGKLV